MLRSASHPSAAEAIKQSGEERFYGPFAEWLSSLEVVPEEFLCQNFELHAVDGARRQVPWELAGAIGVIAARENLFLDPTVLEANYVRRTDAELALKVAL